MRLLLDENLSDRLLAGLTPLFEHRTHVRLVGLASASDDQVWRYARNSGCIIVSKDSDFRQRVLVEGAPPKVVWIRRGNCTTKEILALLEAAHPAIERFAEDDELAFLVVE